MFISFFLFSFVFCETKPKLNWQTCTKSGCTTTSGFIVADDEWRSNGTGDIDYSNQIGVSTDGSALTQKFVTIYNGVKNVGSRLYLLNSDERNYELFNLVNKEFTYDVDLSELPCGLNAALYTIEMPKAGTLSGAQYGTGYCDAQFLGDNQTGCAELDIWEGNARAQVYTTHPCSKLGQFTKGEGSCSSDGCGFNTYRYGEKNFYGNGSSYTLDSSKKFTVVTQFIGSGSTLTEIRRVYVQGGRVIPNANPLVYNTANYDSITDAFCRTAGHSVDTNNNLQRMGESLARGHVLAFSLWDSNDMGWLDAGEYGPCSGGSQEGTDYLETNLPNIKVVWSNVKYGDIDTTY
jgi:cellulose 1,4-beta-cellobiosidase